jgi:hypothetical protein
MFWWGKLEKEISGKTQAQRVGCYKYRFSRSGMGGIDWTDLAQDKDRSWTLVNAVINIRVPQTAGKFLPS